MGKALQISKPPPSPPPKLSLWNYLRAQLTTPMQDEVQSSKHERVYNFLHVPQKLEQLLFFGYFICLDSFLHNFTFLPIRILISFLSYVQSKTFRLWTRGRKPKFELPFFRFDVLRGLLLLIVCSLLHFIDASQVYHSIRGQSVIKLYVIFNVFEILDRLCCSFGLDILDSFFSEQSIPNNNNSNNGNNLKSRIHPVFHYLLTILYVFIHTIVLFYQAITLNVAINSFSNALLTLLVSNQFVEIKSAVFKKFEKENLFQLACADILERFQLSLYLLIIGFRNLTEVSAQLDFDYLIYGFGLPLAMVFSSEIIVDWLKHAFITKFNHIHPDVYLRYIDTLTLDFQNCPFETSIADQSPAVSRRIGFSSFPLSCLLVRILTQTVKVSNMSISSYKLPLTLAIILIFIIKISLGMLLIAFTRRRNFINDNRHIYKADSPEFSSKSTESLNKLHKS